MQTVARIFGPIVIKTDRDLTPSGKRSARIVQTGRGEQLRWYVSGRIYRKLSATQENCTLTREWMATNTDQ